jgi:hypothetical protein
MVHWAPYEVGTGSETEAAWNCPHTQPSPLATDYLKLLQKTLANPDSLDGGNAIRISEAKGSLKREKLLITNINEK